MAAEITLCAPYFPSVSTKVHECDTHLFSFPIWLLCHLARIPGRLLTNLLNKALRPKYCEMISQSAKLVALR